MTLIGEHKIYQYYIKLCTKLRPPIKHNAIIIHHNGKNLQKKEMSDFGWNMPLRRFMASLMKGSSNF